MSHKGLSQHGAQRDPRDPWPLCPAAGLWGHWGGEGLTQEQAWGPAGGAWRSHLCADVVQARASPGRFLGVSPGHRCGADQGRGIWGGLPGPEKSWAYLTWAQPWCGPGGGVSGAFWGSHLGKVVAQAKVAVWGKTHQTAGRVLPGHRTSAGQSGGSGEGLGGVSLGHRHGAGHGGSLRGSWGGLGGLTWAQTRCSPAAMALAGPSQLNTWHFSTCVKGSRATYAKSLGGNEGGTLRTTPVPSPPSPSWD